ncbi:MAG: transposase [Ktedonobacteraceae bacterium]
MGTTQTRKRPMSHHRREDGQLVEHIQAAYHAHRGVYGSPRVHAELQAQGITGARHPSGSSHTRSGAGCAPTSPSEQNGAKRPERTVCAQRLGSRRYGHPTSGKVEWRYDRNLEG